MYTSILTYLFISIFTLVSMAQSPLIEKKIDSTYECKQIKKQIIKYRASSFSTPYKKIRDEGHSPITYRGLTYQLNGYHERLRNKGITKLEFVFGIGFLKTNKNKVSVTTQAPSALLEINYYYLRYISPLLKNKGAIYLGGFLSNTLDGRLYTSLINNLFGYEFSNAINPAIEFFYPLQFGKYQRKLAIGFKSNAALLAHTIRPNFIGMEPVEAYEGEDISVTALFMHNNKILLPNQFIRINTEIYIDRFQLSNQNKIRLSYSWGFHYTKTNTSNPMYSAYHALGVTSMLFVNRQKQPFYKRKIRQS